MSDRDVACFLGFVRLVEAVRVVGVIRWEAECRGLYRETFTRDLRQRGLVR